MQKFVKKLHQLQEWNQNNEFVLNSKIKFHLDELQQLRNQSEQNTIFHENTINVRENFPLISKILIIFLLSVVEKGNKFVKRKIRFRFE